MTRFVVGGQGRGFPEHLVVADVFDFMQVAVAIVDVLDFVGAGVGGLFDATEFVESDFDTQAFSGGCGAGLLFTEIIA